MSEMEITITGQDGDYLFIADTAKGYKGRIHQSLVPDNGLEVVNGKINVSRTLYHAWFKEDLELAARKEAAEFARMHAYKFCVQFDYPVNEEGRGVSAEFFSENEETAKAEAMEVYKDQFGEQATGKIIKFVRYRWAYEVRQFCIEKYGTAYPTKIEGRKIIWLNVPFFSMPYSPMNMKAIPVFEEWEIEEYNMKIEDEIEKHWEIFNQYNKKVRKMLFLSDSKMKKYLKTHPECIEFVELIKKWEEEYNQLSNRLRRGTRINLTTDQLELLGINFDPYRHEYQGGKAYIELKGKRMEIAPEYGKIL